MISYSKCQGFYSIFLHLSLNKSCSSTYLHLGILVMSLCVPIQGQPPSVTARLVGDAAVLSTVRKMSEFVNS